MQIPSIHFNNKFADAAISIVRLLDSAGYTAYLAGGCVRDCLLGLTPKDWDVATSATPEEVLRVFPGAEGVGAAFGVMLVKVEDVTVEVATFRKDGDYSDSRRPDSVEFCDAKEDAKRRDFTVNALFYDVVNDQVIDYVNGMEDIQNRLIRPVGNAVDRMMEDRLRILRGVRFTVTLPNFEMANHWLEYLPDDCDLTGVSRERIGHEIRRMAVSETPNPDPELGSIGTCRPLYRAVHLLGSHDNIDFNRQVFGIDIPPSFAYTGAVTGRHPSFPTLLAHMCYWACYPSCNELKESLVLSNQEVSECNDVIDALESLRKWSDGELSSLEKIRVAARADIYTILGFMHQDVEAILSDPVYAEWHTRLLPEPLIGGDDLIQAGMKPGPEMGKVLDDLYNRQLLDSSLCAGQLISTIP